MKTRSRLLVGRLMHERIRPKRHRFEYPHYWLAIDLAELDALSKNIALLSHNRFNVLSIHDRDYLGIEPKSIREKVNFVLRDKAYVEAIDRVVLVTSPRYFNWVFNPLNFYFCYSTDAKICAVIAEVNNTFSESHLYILDAENRDIGKFAVSYTIGKEFYVSPFNDLEGTYEFYLTDLGDDVDFRLNLIHRGTPLIITRFWGQSIPLGLKPIISILARYPLLGISTLFKITLNAALIWLKGVKHVHKPAPSSPMTYRRNGKSQLP